MEFNDYEKVSVTVDSVILTVDTVSELNNRSYGESGIKVLLLKRNTEPFKDFWSLPGGFVNSEESLEDAFRNKLTSKTNLKDFYTEQLYTYGDVNRDPRGRVITVAYLVLGNNEQLNKEIEFNSAFGELSWFWVGRTKNGITLRSSEKEEPEIQCKLAFDHEKIIYDALLRLENKALYTDVAFEVLPDKFTIRQCQDAYELMANRTIYSFRRFINNKVDDTGDVEYGKAHRPAALFRHKIAGEE